MLGGLGEKAATEPILTRLLELGRTPTLGFAGARRRCWAASSMPIRPRASLRWPRRHVVRKMSELGVPFATEMKMGIKGEGPMAEAMKKMGSARSQTEVTSISTASIPADSVRDARRATGQKALAAAGPAAPGVSPRPLAACDAGRRVRRRLTGTWRDMTEMSRFRRRARSARSAALGDDNLVGPERHPAGRCLHVARRRVLDGARPRLPPIDDDVEAGVPLNATDRRSKSSALPRGTTIR